MFVLFLMSIVSSYQSDMSDIYIVGNTGIWLNREDIQLFDKFLFFVTMVYQYYIIFIHVTIR